jgi:signal peptidase I
VLAALCLLLWPQRWGGSMTYVITHGVSMQPSFHAGDLAILRTSDRYDVGDVVAYRSDALKTIVMHRILSKGPAGYTFKGDNNDFVDPGVVTDDQLLGSLVLRLPKVGAGLRWLVDPLHLVLAAGGLFLLFSDRRKEEPAPAPAPVAAAAGGPLVVRITALRLPQELPTADVSHPEDLLALAGAHGLAVLRDETTDYVLQGGLVFRHVRAVEGQLPESRRRRASTGRDWQYPQAAHPDVIDLASRRSA